MRHLNRPRPIQISLAHLRQQRNIRTKENRRFFQSINPGIQDLRRIKGLAERSIKRPIPLLDFLDNGREHTGNHVTDYFYRPVFAARNADRYSSRSIGCDDIIRKTPTYDSDIERRRTKQIAPRQRRLETVYCDNGFGEVVDSAQPELGIRRVCRPADDVEGQAEHAFVACGEFAFCRFAEDAGAESGV